MQGPAKDGRNSEPTQSGSALGGRVWRSVLFLAAGVLIVVAIVALSRPAH